VVSLPIGRSTHRVLVARGGPRDRWSWAPAGVAAVPSGDSGFVVVPDLFRIESSVASSVGLVDASPAICADQDAPCRRRARMLIEQGAELAEIEIAERGDRDRAAWSRGRFSTMSPGPASRGFVEHSARPPFGSRHAS